jgi:hypothetical protein
MGLSSRHYLFADDGLYRLSNRVMSGLAGEYTLPQYAATNQKVAIVVLQNEGKKPLKILEVHGRYYSFDAPGNAAEELREAPPLANSPLVDYVLGADKRSSTVVDIGPEVRRGRFMRELTKLDIDRIKADIWKKPIVAEKVKDVKVVASKTRKRRGGTRSGDEAR